MTVRQRVRVVMLGVAISSMTTLSPTLIGNHARAQLALGGTAGVSAYQPPTLPDSAVVDVSKEAGSTKSTPAFRLLPQFVPGSEDWSRPYADILDREYDKWLAFKKGVSDQFNLDIGIDYSFYPQWGTKGNPVYANVYYPYATWKPFT